MGLDSESESAMLIALLRKLLAVYALGVCALVVSSCAQERSQTSKSFATWEWGGIARAVSAAPSASNPNYVFGTSTDEVGSLAELASVYNPSMERLGEGYVAPDKDQLVVFDSDFRKQSEKPLEGLGLPTQTTSAGSVDNKTAVFVFNESTSDSPYSSRIVLATKETTSAVPRDRRPVALRACTNETAVWLERDEDDGSGLTLVRMGTDGLLSESRLDTPAGTVASEYFSTLGCGKEKSYISFPDDIGGADVVSVGSPNEKPTLMHEGRIEGLPIPGVNRSSRYEEGSVSYFTSRGTIVAVDLEHQEVKETEPLIGTDRRPVSATIDGGNVHIVTQPIDGAEELRVHSFSFKDPVADKDGTHIAKLSQLMQGSTAHGAYTIPMSIYPFDKRTD
ncbi:hypothetical protein [Corynebacterium singulare]|uniref:Lactonase, 7-bladed beta-propeller n=2 Tax=Corynebacterium singulare TaxID=161899 RepID=A0A0B6EZT4_9CORY|nr:hypothetical protein [Corynebacterium singulare]AJI77690.1 hypothetical protein CSING_00610 [Corynebacterium singulare]